MNRPVAIVCSAAIGLAGCATSSKDIASAYVSPLQYQSYDCAQIAAEVQRIQSRVVDLGGRLDEAASNDKAIMGVGLILFWPALFALGGTKQQEAEYARLKGEYEALQQAAVARKCAGAVAITTTTESGPAPDPASVAEAERRLALLREMKAKGMLTDAEFDQKRAAIADVVLAAQTPSSPSPPTEATTGVVGLRFVLRDSDPHSKAVSGELSLSIDSVSERGTVLNGGTTTLDPTGRVLTGTVPVPHLAGLGGGRLTPGVTTTASFIPVAVVPPVDVRVRVLRIDTMRLSNRDIAVVRCAVSGYASHVQIPGMRPGSLGAAISGEIAVEPATGLVFSANVQSMNPYYALNRAPAPLALP